MKGALGTLHPLPAGGGYLNGSWTPEIYLKLQRLNAFSGHSELVVMGSKCVD